MLFYIVQSVYWLALATWFGGMLFSALAAPIILASVREARPILPEVLSPNLDNQHGSLLAGAIMGNLLTLLSRIHTVCASVLFICLTAQFFVSSVGNPQRMAAAVVRCSLYFAVVVMTIYDRRFLWPRIWQSRQEYIDHADEPDIANPANDRFAHFQRESATMMALIVGGLMGIILFSSFIRP